MNPSWQTAFRALATAAGVAVTLVSVLYFRLADWPLYLVYVALSSALVLPSVEVLPGVLLLVPELATTLGFLYIAGPPVMVLRILTPSLTLLLRWLLPEAWQSRLPQLRRAGLGGWPFTPSNLARLGHSPRGRENAPAVVEDTPAEWAIFTLGLWARWWIVSSLFAETLPITNVAAIAVAEVSGYACWGVLSVLPIYPDRPNSTFLPLSYAGGLRTALTDLGLIVMLALTPFVFLITYGFQTHGLAGAAGWSIAAIGLHFVLQRLSERRLTVEEQNRRLEALNRELEHRERLSAIGKMSSVVSHQILHQLGVIGLYADLIRNDDAGSDAETGLAQVRNYGVAIEEALRDVNRVLKDLLVFSKDLRLNLYEHPLAGVLEECIEECRAQAGGRGVALRAECPAEVNVTLDKLKMKQALVNVIRNAIEAAPTGSEVVVRARARDGHADVEVADQAPGIPLGNRDAVFTPFFTTKEHGTGLGLAIAREFTEAHGGRLTVAGNNGRPGATFVFHLPLRPGSDHIG